jgi:hypothetical protein
MVTFGRCPYAIANHLYPDPHPRTRAPRVARMTLTELCLKCRPHNLLPANVPTLDLGIVNQRPSESWQYDLNSYNLLCIVAEYLVCFYPTSFYLCI